MSTVVRAHITSSWEMIITSLYQILIYNFVLVDILIEIIVLKENLYHYSHPYQVR